VPIGFSIVPLPDLQSATNAVINMPTAGTTRAYVTFTYQTVNAVDPA
jgi:hypothetical protein